MTVRTYISVETVRPIAQTDVDARTTMPTAGEGTIFADALEVNRSVTSLDLSGNNLGDRRELVLASQVVLRALDLRTLH